MVKSRCPTPKVQDITIVCVGTLLQGVHGAFFGHFCNARHVVFGVKRDGEPHSRGPP